jgi:hypothetical protein
LCFSDGSGLTVQDVTEQLLVIIDNVNVNYADVIRKAIHILERILRERLIDDAKSDLLFFSFLKVSMVTTSFFFSLLRFISLNGVDALLHRINAMAVPSRNLFWIKCNVTKGLLSPQPFPSSLIHLFAVWGVFLSDRLCRSFTQRIERTSLQSFANNH